MFTGRAAEVIVDLFGSGLQFVVISTNETLNVGEVVYGGIGTCYLLMDGPYEVVGLLETVGGG